MTGVIEFFRLVIRFFLALFLWLHAFFLFGGHSVVISTLTRWLRLTSVETVLFLLLLIFWFVAGSGLWKTTKNLAYLYFFPVILVFACLYFAFSIIRVIGKKFDVRPLTEKADIEIQPVNKTLDLPAGPKKPSKLFEFSKFYEVVSRPFRRFTLIWCMLLALATHTFIVWGALLIVLLHLIRASYHIIFYAFLSTVWFDRIVSTFHTQIENLFTRLQSASEKSGNKELKEVVQQLRIWEKAVRFAQNRGALRSWSALLFGLALLCIYLYLATVFSFVYLGIARVYNVDFRWAEAFVTSIFMPLFIGDLPRILAIKIIGGIHGVLVVTLGIGTIFNYLHRKLDAIRQTASTIIPRFEDAAAQERIRKFEEFLKTDPT